MHNRVKNKIGLVKRVIETMSQSVQRIAQRYIFLYVKWLSVNFDMLKINSKIKRSETNLNCLSIHNNNSASMQWLDKFCWYAQKIKLFKCEMRFRNGNGPKLSSVIQRDCKVAKNHRSQNLQQPVISIAKSPLIFAFFIVLNNALTFSSELNKHCPFNNVVHNQRLLPFSPLFKSRCCLA